MNKSVLIAGFIGVMASAVAPLAAEEQTPWPYPEDTPKASKVSVGLAGETPYDITRYMMMRGARSQQISSDARTMAYISNVTGVPQIWITDIEGKAPRQLTVGNGVTFYRWSPDGTSILYGADNNGDEREAYYLITVNGMSERQVLPFSKGYRRFGGFSPDGKRIVYSSTERNGVDFDIYVADIDAGESKLVKEGHFGYFANSWQPKGDWVIVTEARGEDARDVHLLNVETGEFKTIFKPKVAAEYTSFTWYWRGSRFFYASNEGRENMAIFVYDMEEGTSKLWRESEYEIDNVKLCGGGRYLAWTTNVGGYSKLHLYDFMEKRDAQAPYLKDGVYGLNWTPAHESYLSININGPDTPGDIFVWRVSDGVMTPAVKSEMAGVFRYSMKRPEDISFKARDGVKVHGLLYMPKAEEGVKPPVVFRVHGGPTAQARPTFRPEIQYLVGKGIAVLDINVRGSTGFGKKYARLDNQKNRLDSVRDLVDAVKYLKKDGRVDADRAAVMGGSYGGYMVNAVMGAYPDVFKAGASFVGVSDWVKALQEASPGLKASDRIEYGDIREEKWQKFYAKISPINNAHKIKAPMLFSHGVNDPRDPVTESDRMVQTIRDNGYEVTYLRWPDEGHGIRKIANRITFYRRLADFLETHIGDGKE